tara:strand:- start:170 stop:484 length:315 start_codon:yes stop_codon:yes gene_type:complete
MANSFVTNLYPKPTVGVTDQSLTVADSAVPFGTAFNSLTRYVVLDVQTADVRVTYDGSDPVAGSNGHLLFAGRSYTWSKEAAANARFVREGSTSANIHASEFTN